MIKNRKGFMLVEVIITATVILTSMILLYSSFQSLLSKYETRNKYHHVDALYATKEIIDYLLQEDFNKFINTNLYQQESLYLIKEKQCQNLELSEDFNSLCTIIQDLYSVESMIFTSYDQNNLKNLKNGLIESETVKVEAIKNQTMKEYIDYIIGYYGITNENINVDLNPYSYFIITEISDGEDYYYANIPIR